ncbi:MAG: LysR family transcriptional regulator [Rhodobacteraceae bacterium]|nr:MAG: LysR family transcriptional regulator [Paracoccaceae bacterium]
MHFKQLQYFVAVAEEMHFGRAAERLGMAQPPLSRQIKQLEDQLGAVLFNRGRNAIALTQAGDRLYAHARDILRSVEDAEAEVRRIGEGAEGRLRIGFVGSATYGIVPNIVKSFRASFPAVALSLYPMNNAQLKRSLIRRDIDIAFARPALRDAEFVTRKLVDEPLRAAVPDTWVTQNDSEIALAEVRDQVFILYPERPRPSFADLVLERCLAQGLEIGKRVFTMDLQTALSLVAIGEGICIVPDSVASAQRNGIRFPRLTPSLGNTELSLNYRLDEQGKHVQNFARTARAEAAKAG